MCKLKSDCFAAEIYEAALLWTPVWKPDKNDIRSVEGLNDERKNSMAGLVRPSSFYDFPLTALVNGQQWQ